MIKYNLGRECKISFNDFLKLTLENSDVKYKSEFEHFSELFEFIDKNVKQISHMLFDGYEYFIEKGKLHNLYGPAYITYTEDKSVYGNGTNNYFYIDGKLVCDGANVDRGCTTIKSFKEDRIFHYMKLTNKKNGYIDEYTGERYKTKIGVDFDMKYINLNDRIKMDQRKKKLIQLSK